MTVECLNIQNKFCIAFDSSGLHSYIVANRRDYPLTKDEIMKKIYYAIISAVVIWGLLAVMLLYAGQSRAEEENQYDGMSMCPPGSAWSWQDKMCLRDCDRKMFPYDDKPDESKGKISQCWTGKISYWGYEKCYTGWKLKYGDCVASACEHFPYTIKPRLGDKIGTLEICKTGEGYYYRYKDCVEGFEFDSYTCTEHVCASDKFPYNVSPDASKGKAVSCLQGFDKKFGYSECFDGWTLKDGDCVASECHGFPYAYIPDNKKGKTISCQQGTKEIYGYSECFDGWELKNGDCVATECKDYPSSDVLIEGCKSTKKCLSGFKHMYQCDECDTGYKTMNGLCIATCSYQLEKAPEGCEDVDTCEKADIAGKVSVYYSSACKSCKAGYLFDEDTGKCNRSGCEDMTTGDGIAYCVKARKCYNGDEVWVSCIECESAYKKESGVCKAVR